ncbi:MAG: O-antigen ligase family protein [Longimicrobiales bacterium]
MSTTAAGARPALEPVRAGVILVLLGVAATAALEPWIGLALSLVPAGIAALLWVLADPRARLAPGWLASAFIGAWLPPIATVAGFNIRAHQLFLGITVAVFLLRPAVIGQRPPWARQYALPMAALWAVALLWTTFNSPFLALGLGHVALLGLNLIHAWLLMLLIGDDTQVLRRCFRLLAWATIAALGWTVFVLTAAQAGVQVVRDLIFIDAVPLVGPTGVRSGEIARFVWGLPLASYFASLTLICAGLLRCRGWGSRPLFAIAAVAGAVGVVLEPARGPIVAFLGGVLTYGIGLLVQGRLVRLATTAGGALALIGAAYFAVAVIDSPRYPVRDAFMGRFVQLATVEQYTVGTASERMHVWRHMLEDIRSRPLAGAGFDAYRTYVSKDDQTSENFPLEVLHSTGVIGFGAFAAFQLLAVWRAVRVVLRHRLETSISHAVLSLLAAHAGLTLATATNPAGTGALYWMLYGLLVAAAEMGLRMRPRGGGNTRAAIQPVSP